MDIIDKIDRYLNETKQEDLSKIKDLLNTYNKKHNGNQKKIRKDILDNIVNSKYNKPSNEFVDMMWSEFNKMFPS